MNHSPGLITTAADVLVRRYGMTEDDALDVLFSRGRTGTSGMTDLASWLVYDADGRYHPEPHQPQSA